MDAFKIKRLSQELPDKTKACPACGVTYSDGQLIVCSRDGTLLIPAKNHYVNEFVVANRFAFHELVGVGEMTAVYAGEDLVTNSKVAIKVLREHLLADRKTHKRFENEALTAAKLVHKNIATPIAFGTIDSENQMKGRPYFVTEFLYGETLAELIKSHPAPPALSESYLVRLMAQVCGALEYAHTQGCVHRDLKPSNLFIVENESEVGVKIVDFGLAERLFRFLEWNQVSTHTTSVYGNPAYMCPDFALGNQPDVSTDIYSLGCIMYETLSGSPPFIGNNNFDTIHKHMTASPKEFAPELGISERLSRIIFKCLNKEPKDRFLSFAELGEALQAGGS